MSVILILLMQSISTIVRSEDLLPPSHHAVEISISRRAMFNIRDSGFMWPAYNSHLDERFQSSIDVDEPVQSFANSDAEFGSFTFRNVAIRFGQLHLFGLSDDDENRVRAKAYVYNVRGAPCTLKPKIVFHPATTLSKCSALSEVSGVFLII